MHSPKNSDIFPTLGRGQVRGVTLLAIAVAGSLAASVAMAAGTVLAEPPAFAGIPIDFILFALMLVGAQKRYLSQSWPRFSEIAKALVAGIVAGLLAGLAGQSFLNLFTTGSAWWVAISQVIGWTIRMFHVEHIIFPVTEVRNGFIAMLR